MITTIAATADEAVAGVEDGSTVLVGGFGLAGMPFDLIDALIRQGAGELTVVSNNAGNGEVGLAALLKAGRVRKVICSFPRQSDSYVFDELYRFGRIELEVVPQGTLAERMRPQAPASVPSTAPSAPAPSSPRARRPGRSTGAPTSWSTRPRETWP